MLGSVKVNTNREQFGAFGDVLGADYRKSELDPQVLEDISKLQDYRPFFTYWVTFVQIIIFIFTISVYDISYVGLSETRVEKEVRTIRLSIEKVHYDEKDNMWIGPSQADLIHLGAKYSPCMRLDENVVKKLEEDRTIENQSGCCIYNDGSGCAQMVKGKCPPTLATWTKTVCGQDPDYCANSSQLPTLWNKENITEWPICYANKNLNSSSAPKHMTCDIVARPCCVGILGQCIITTPDYCKFRKGYFHPEATMCSQVTTCLSEICGMLPFYNPMVPDHFYRLWTSLFLHAGLLQLVITVIFQFMVMRNIEELLGWFRIGVIYILSGIAGSLASAVFLPYHAEAGPSGSQFAMIACLFVELIQGWRLKIIQSGPALASLAKFGLVILILFIIGLFPWIDNWAHLFGFIFGFLLSFALMPYVNFDIFKRKGRIVSVVISLSLVTGVFVMLFILFYVFPIYTCRYCHYFNCIPFTEYFCKSMEVDVAKNYDWSAAS